MSAASTLGSPGGAFLTEVVLIATSARGPSSWQSGWCCSR